MKFFTPEIYRDLNSRDRKKALAAHEKWEHALEAYGEHLSEIERKLPSRVRELAHSLCLHDAEFEGHLLPTVGGQPLAILMMRQESESVYLVYMLAKKPQMKTTNRRSPVSRHEVLWLYDEFDVGADGIPQHEILLSDGRTLSLRFTDLEFLHKPLPQKIAV